MCSTRARLLEKLRSGVGWPTTTFFQHCSLFSFNPVVLNIRDTALKPQCNALQITDKGSRLLKGRLRLGLHKTSKTTYVATSFAFVVGTLLRFFGTGLNALSDILSLDPPISCSLFRTLSRSTNET